MSAYDNPTIIRDTSLGIYNQAIQAFGQIVASGKMAAQKARAARAAATEKERIRVQGIAGGIQTAAWKDANKNIAAYKESGGQMYDSYLENVTWLMDGKGIAGQKGYEMGAIEAITRIQTQDIEPNERKYLQSIVNRAQQYQTNAINGVGLLVSDLEDFEGVSPESMNITHYWNGANALEEDTSMLTTYSLKNYKKKGLTSVKEMIVGDNGGSRVRVTSRVDKTSDIFQKLHISTQKELEENGYKLVWEEDATSFDNNKSGGLIRKISKTIDAASITKEANVVDPDTKNIVNKFLVGDFNNKTNVTEDIGDNRQNNTTVSFINEDALLTDDIISAKIDGAVANLQGKKQDQLGDLKAAMENTLKMGKDDWGIAADTNNDGIVDEKDGVVNNFLEFKKLTPEEQKRILRVELEEEYMQTSFQQKLKFKDLNVQQQNFLKDKLRTTSPDLGTIDENGDIIGGDKDFYFKIIDSKTTEIKDGNDFAYQTEVYDKLQNIDLPNESLGFDATTEDNTKYNLENAKIHKRFLEDEFNLNVALGLDAYNMQKKYFDGLVKKGAINKGTGEKWTREEAELEYKDMKRDALYVKVGTKYIEQTAYRSFDNNSLKKIIGDNARGFKNSKSNQNWQNKFVNKPRPGQ